MKTHGDSPLTSTGFSEAYKNEEIIKTASEANGILTKQLMEYLNVKKNPIAVKMAIINNISWDFNCKDNANVWYNYLALNQGYTSKNDFLKKGKDYELL